MKKHLILGLVVMTIFSCNDEEKNPFTDKVVGKYEGVINYLGTIPIPGDDMVERLDFYVIKEGENKIKVTTTFDLVLPVTGMFTSDSSGHEIISLGAGREITYRSNEIDIYCGGTDYNSWGEMCGYYNVTNKNLTIAFGWSNEDEGGSGIIVATRID
jgi:hypothetical protein